MPQVYLKPVLMKLMQLHSISNERLCIFLLSRRGSNISGRVRTCASFSAFLKRGSETRWSVHPSLPRELKSATRQASARPGYGYACVIMYALHARRTHQGQQSMNRARTHAWMCSECIWFRHVRFRLYVWMEKDACRMYHEKQSSAALEEQEGHQMPMTS